MGGPGADQPFLKTPVLMTPTCLGQPGAGGWCGSIISMALGESLKSPTKFLARTNFELNDEISMPVVTET